MLLTFENILFTLQNVTIHRYTTLNLATLFPTTEDSVPHDCLVVLDIVPKPRLEISDKPDYNADCFFFVDGSSLHLSDGSPSSAYAICTSDSVVEPYRLPSHLSAQAAELFSLTRAWILASGKSLTLFKDSNYVFHTLHDTGVLYKHHGFLMSAGKPITYKTLIMNLLDAVLLPTCVAVCKCHPHSKDNDLISLGNSFTDEMAKKTANFFFSSFTDAAVTIRSVTDFFAGFSHNSKMCHPYGVKGLECSLFKGSKYWHMGN